MTDINERGRDRERGGRGRWMFKYGCMREDEEREKRGLWKREQRGGEVWFYRFALWLVKGKNGEEKRERKEREWEKDGRRREENERERDSSFFLFLLLPFRSQILHTYFLNLFSPLPPSLFSFLQTLTYFLTLSHFLSSP